MSVPQFRIGRRLMAACAAIAALSVTPAFAQQPAPPQTPTPTPAPATVTAAPPADDRIAPFVLDLRPAFGKLGQSEFTAANFGVAPEGLPKRGFGGVGGLHVYPFRRGRFALGVGGEVVRILAFYQEKDNDGAPVGRAIRRRMEGLSGQVSLNFGHRTGWSYLSGGMGPLGFDTYFDKDIPDGLKEMTLNYGAGARWFNYDHLAFSVDVRFYATGPANPTLIVGARERQTVLVISAGIALK